MRPARSSARTPSGGQPASRAASASGGGAATASAASSRSIASSAPPAAAAARRGSRTRSPSRASAPSSTSAVDDVRRRPSRRRPIERHEAARRRRQVGAQRRQRHAGCRGFAAWCAATSSIARLRSAALDVRREPPRAAVRSAPWRSSRAGRADPARFPGAAARARSARRRETPRGGEASRTTPPPATEPGDGRRSANRSPGAAAIGRVEAEDRERRAVREVDRLARPAHDERADLVRAEVQPEPVAIRRRPGREPAPRTATSSGRGDDLRVRREDPAAPQARRRRRRAGARSGHRRPRRPSRRAPGPRGRAPSPSPGTSRSVRPPSPARPAGCPSPPSRDP